MNEQHQCALRALTLCDGHVAVTPAPRVAPIACYCSLLAEAVRLQDPVYASEVRHARAMTVARAAETERLIRYRRNRLGDDF